MSVSLAKVLAATELTKSQAAAITKLFGPEWKEGQTYRRVGPPGVKTLGDIYVAVKADKLGDGENGEGGYDMLNLTRKDREHILTKFSPEKFELAPNAIRR